MSGGETRDLAAGMPGSIHIPFSILVDLLIVIGARLISHVSCPFRHHDSDTGSGGPGSNGEGGSGEPSGGGGGCERIGERKWSYLKVVEVRLQRVV